jgi:hypothetical protein
MRTESDIARLCETWWGQLAHSNKAEHQHFVQDFLALLGWQKARPVECKGKTAELTTASYLLRAGAQTSLAAHFVVPGQLEPPAVVVERGLDFCETTRLLVNVSRSVQVDYVFITDLYRSYLYDCRTDELLLYANGPSDFDRDFSDVFSRAGIERGCLEEIRRQPRSVAARQLREWATRWAGALAAEAGTSVEEAGLIIDRLLVVRYLFDHDILRRAGWRIKKRFSDVVQMAFEGHGSGVGATLCGLFHDMWFDWKADLFAAHPGFDAALSKDALAVPLLREFALLSSTKFSIGTILESFNYGDATEKARVRMVPDHDEERETHLHKQTLETVDEVRLTVDLTEEGYRAIFYWFDRLTALYQRLETEFDHQTFRERSRSGDLDLFSWSQIDAHRPAALTDRYQHAVEKGLSLYYLTPRQYRTSRLMLYLHLIGRYEQSKQPFTQFPRIEDALQKRPVNLDSKRLFQASSPANDEWEVV